MTVHRISGERSAAARAAGENLATAFADDPLMHIMAPDPTRRAKVGPWFWARSVTYGLRWGQVWVDEDAQGAAIWLTPGNTDMSPGRLLRAGLGTLPLRIGITGMRRFAQAGSFTEPTHKRVTGDHWYLLAVGVRPDAQGTGVGSALIRAGTDQADAEGLPCYLETGTAENVALYEKRGFVPLDSAEVLGFQLTGMLRPPR